MAEARRRGSSESCDEPSVGKASGPVAENARREALVRDDDAGALGRRRQLGLDDRRKRQVTERAAALPTLVALVGDDPLGARGRVEVGERRQPVEPG
jgi:hypothetical protein